MTPKKTAPNLPGKDALVRELKKLRQQINEFKGLEAAEHVEQEAKLKRSSQFLDHILNALDDPVFVKDEQHRWVLLNDAACRVMGHPRRKMIGKTDYDLYPKKQARVFWEQDEKALKTGQTQINQGQVTWQGKTHITSTKKSPFTDSATGARYIAGTIRDITQEKGAENRLRESEEKYRNIVELAPDGITTLDRRGVVTSCNDAFLGMSGYRREEIVGRHFTKLPSMNKKDLLRYIKLFPSLIRGKVPPPLEVTWYHKNGTPLFGEVHVGLMKKNKAIAGLQVIIRDITGRKADEEDRRQLEEQLHQAEKMQAIGQLAGGIAHDFNNQLGVIMGFADLLKDNYSENDKYYRHVEAIIRSAQRASGLTKQLLAFARKGKYQAVTVNIHKIISEVVSLLEFSIDKRIRLKQRLEAHPPLTSGDPNQLQNALLNIALNARDAMPRGGELVFATNLVLLDRDYCRNQPYKIVPGQYLLISISDTGVGMNEDTERHIFEPFFTTKAKGKGTGMGLAAVYGTVKSHRGAIEVQSRPKQGTTFKLFLPLAPDETGEPVEKGPSAVVKGSSRILVVDDEKLVREMATAMLRRLGYRVITAADGVEAIRYFSRHHREIDLVILDMVMPRLSGHDTFLKMKEINPRVKTVLSSGYSLDVEAREVLKQGAFRFVQKPFRRDELSQVIDEVLKKE